MENSKDMVKLVERYLKIRARRDRGEGEEKTVAAKLLAQMEKTHPELARAVAIHDEWQRRKAAQQGRGGTNPTYDPWAQHARTGPPPKPNPFDGDPFPDFPSAEQWVNQQEFPDTWFGRLQREAAAQFAQWADRKVGDLKENWDDIAKQALEEAFKTAPSTKQMRQEYIAVATITDLLDDEDLTDLHCTVDEDDDDEDEDRITIELTVPRSVWARCLKSPKAFVEYLDNLIEEPDPESEDD